MPSSKNQAEIYDIKCVHAPCNNADGVKQLMVGFIFLSTLHHIIDPFTVDLRGNELEVPELNVMFCVPFNQTSSIKERGKEEKLEGNNSKRCQITYSCLHIVLEWT